MAKIVQNHQNMKKYDKTFTDTDHMTLQVQGGHGWQNIKKGPEENALKHRINVGQV